MAFCSICGQRPEYCLCPKKEKSMTDCQDPEGCVEFNELLEQLTRIQAELEAERGKSEEMLFLGVGWSHADACCDLDAGRDPRHKDVDDMIERAHVDFEVRKDILNTKE